MSVYFLPALISLLFKLFILMLVARGGKVSILFLSLIVVFATHNAIELIGYIQFSDHQALELLFRPYYAVSIFLLMYVLLHGLAVSSLTNRYITAMLILVATLMSVLVLFSDSIVAGQYHIGYTMTAIQGSYYWVFAVYIFIVLISNIVVLLHGYKSATSNLKAIRCAYSLFALAPVMIVVMVSIILKISGTGMNAAGIFPIATTIFLAVVLKGESKHKLTDIRRFLPFSPERKTASVLMEVMDEYVNSNNQTHRYKELRNGIERQVIIYTLHKCDNNITKAAEMMGLENRSTLYSMMNRLKISHKEM